MDQQFYRYGSTVLYDGIFDIDQDIIVSCLVTSPSGNIGDLQIQDERFFLLENGEGLKLNVPNLYDNISIFLLDANVSLLSGGGYSSSCGSFVLSSNGETNDRTPLSAENTLIQLGSNFRVPNTLLSNISLPENNQTIWATNPANLFINTESVYAGLVAIAPDKVRGWVVVLSGNANTGGQIAWESGLSASQGNPWEVITWYPNADTKFNTATFSLTAGDTPIFNNWNITPQRGGTTIDDNLTTHISQSATLQRFNNPGLGLVQNQLRFTAPNSLKDTTSLSGFSALSGLVAIASFDRNGASSYGSNLDAFPAGTGSDTGNTVSLTATQSNFSVRMPEPFTSTTQNITAFICKGTVPLPAPVPADDDEYEVLRVGFRRRLQDVVLYTKETDVEPYEVASEIETNLATDTKPIDAVRVGIAYRGQMPLALKNLTVNAISGTGNSLL